MTETPGPSTDEQHQSQQPPGVDRQHLRSYEDLRRSVTDRKIAGVAGGLGRHLNLDPTVVRVLLVVLCFFGGAGFVLYGAAWLLVPEEGRSEGTVHTSPATRNVLLIAAGVVAALLLVGDGWGGVGFPWPLFLVGTGVVLYLVLRDRPPRAAVPPAGATFGGPAGAGPQYTGAQYTAPAYADPTYTGPTYTGPTYAGPPPDGTPPWLPAPQPAYQPPRRKRGPRLFGITLALVALALGTLGLYEAGGGSVTDAAYPAVALAVVGLMLVVGSLVGRAGGLILLGLVAMVTLVATSVVGSFSGFDVRDGEHLTVAPTSASAVRDSYRISTGRVYVDLSSLGDPQDLAGRTIDVEARAGEVVVVLPDGVRSRVLADVDGPGQIDLPDHSAGGIGTTITGDYGSGAGTVTIDTHLSAGHIDVRNQP